jgi:hypothetical protein
VEHDTAALTPTRTALTALQALVPIAGSREIRQTRDDLDGGSVPLTPPLERRRELEMETSAHTGTGLSGNQPRPAAVAVLAQPGV